MDGCSPSKQEEEDEGEDEEDEEDEEDDFELDGALAPLARLKKDTRPAWAKEEDEKQKKLPSFVSTCRDGQALAAPFEGLTGPIDRFEGGSVSLIFEALFVWIDGLN